MNRSRNLIIILITIIVVLVIALAGTIIYIVTDNQNNNPVLNNIPVVENNVEDNQNEVVEGDNNVQAEGEQNNEVIENEVENQVENEVENSTETTDENNAVDNNVTISPEQTENEIVTDTEKLIFNTTLTKYLGNITGEKLNNLLAELQTSNEKNPNHIVTLSSNNLPNLDGIVATDTYTITFSYGEDGYVNNINIDKKV